MRVLRKEEKDIGTTREEIILRCIGRFDSLVGGGMFMLISAPTYTVGLV